MSHSISPSHLSPASKRFYRNVVASYALDEAQRALLAQALEQKDVGDQAWEVIKHGTTYTTPSGTIKSRPEVAIQRQAYALYGRHMKQLDLTHAKKLHADESAMTDELQRLKLEGRVRRELQAELAAEAQS